MVTQTMLAVDNGWLTVDDLEAEEPKIFVALPALTIVQAIQESQGCNGIRLLYGKILNQNNCPADPKFQELVQPILSVQTKISAFSDLQLTEIKQTLATDSNLPNETMLNTPALLESFAAIKLTTIEILQRRSFHEMVPQVIKTYLESREAVSTPAI